MINVYMAPFSDVYLSNKLFSYDKALSKDDCLSPYRYLKTHCDERDINLNTIDLWKDNDYEHIYVAFNHRKNTALENNKFKKKILFQFEPPVVAPSVYKNIHYLLKIYDNLFFSCILDIANPKCHYFNIPGAYNSVLDNYWTNTNRAFLTMINMNKKPRSRHKELYSERIKAAKFFSGTNEIDLYGFGWDKCPYFPYWFYKSALQKVYRGSVESKYQTLSKYDFAICFENMIAPGFVTEKIFDCFFAGTVPVYLGAPDIKKYVPKECFIDLRDFKDYRELRLFLKSLTKSEIESYREKACKYLDSEHYKPFTKEHFAKMFVDVIKKQGKGYED